MARSIKNLKPNRNSNFKQGYYNPTNVEKYKGAIADLDAEGKPIIIYRSMWELKFMQWCDLHPNIKEWCSEPIAIPYINPCKKYVREPGALVGKFVAGPSNYYVDFWILVDKGDGPVKWLMEIKPGSQVPTNAQLLKAQEIMKGNVTMKKLKRYNYAMKVLLVNRAKFIAARKFAEQQGWKFAIADEHFLF